MGFPYEPVAKVVFTIYSSALFFLFCYGIIQLHLVYQYRKKKQSSSPYPPHFFPFVTVQLPVYNESLVIERLIDAVAKFEYPKDKWEIQILDDSTDETSDIIRKKTEQYRRLGLQLRHIQRANRKGYKAGALQNGLASAKGEFIAIFDADFVPSPSFLQQTIPHFQNEKTGMVQTRWTHLNRNNSLLTHMQAFLLDAHFSIEQSGRNKTGCFINFSGTGGVWRKSTMLDAGGWEADTLTEDFDLSYRAQLKGWRFVYLENVTVPAELPPVMSALKAQQFRWIKGNAETARKHVGNVLKAKLPLQTKVHAFFHLMVGMVFISAFVASFLSVPLLVAKPYLPQFAGWYRYASFSLISLFCLGIFHYTSTVHTGYIRHDARQFFFRMFPLYLSFSMGMAFSNAVAVCEAWLGRKSAFIRTPKFNSSNAAAGQFSSDVKHRLISGMFVTEFLLMLYFLTGALLAFHYDDFSMFPYHLMLAFGFSMIVWFTIKEWQLTLQYVQSSVSPDYKVYKEVRV